MLRKAVLFAISLLLLMVSASAQEARERGHFHNGLHCVTSMVNEGVEVRDLVSLTNLLSPHNFSIIRG